jgi:hypothetical protein
MLFEKAECALATVVDDGQRAGFRNRQFRGQKPRRLRE